MSMQITVSLPPEQYRAVAEIALKQGIQAHTLLEQLVQRALQPALERSEVERFLSNIRRLHATGRNDRQIAENLGVKRAAVSHQRGRMGLPANDNRGRKSTTNSEERTAA